MQYFFFKKRSYSYVKEPTDVSILLKMVLDKNNISEDIVFKAIKEGFEQVVGKLILPHVEPIGIDKNILMLKAENSIWKQELFLQKKAIIDKCNLLLNKPAIRDIRFI
ncbi:MAG: DUF721 domain-containing protein [Fibrobacter sp.]|nr:DUF721 domain-containing protein [Fibrobacter sp.]